MLDGQRYFSEFPDENPDPLDRILTSEKVIVALRALERELSAFIHSETMDSASIAAGGEVRADDNCEGSNLASRDSAKT